jgi:hypothetical protein
MQKGEKVPLLPSAFILLQAKEEVRMQNEEKSHFILHPSALTESIVK